MASLKPFLLPICILSLVCLAIIPQVGARRSTSDKDLVTSSKVCLSTTECASTSFCQLHDLTKTINTCVKRQRLNERCDIFDPTCQPGLYCKPNDFQGVCRKQRGLGNSCTNTEDNPCAGNLTCSAGKGVCAPASTVGLAGQKCYNHIDCNRQQSLFCNRVKSECQVTKPAGGRCESWFGNCQGFCVDAEHDTTGVCIDHLHQGSPCTTDHQCRPAASDTPGVGTTPLICNIPVGQIGRCMREKDLHVALGESCNPQFDFCDSRRGLSCRPVAGGRTHVCQQMVSMRQGGHYRERFCTPGSALSTCVQEDQPTVCRKSRGRYRPIPNFFKCLPPLEVLPRGSICDGFASSEDTMCEPGTVCTVIHDVVLRTDQRYKTQLKMCVRLSAVGGQCGNGFRTQCRAGLRCVDGVCEKGVGRGGSGKDKLVTYMGFCTVRKCIPGTVCDRPDNVPSTSGVRRCLFPVKMIEEGDACMTTDRFRLRCRSGLVCSRDDKAEGLKLCRKPHGIGARCESHEHCAGKLRCSPHSLDIGGYGRCYDKALSLPLGAPCKAGAKAGEAQCVFTWTTLKLGGIVPRETRCLRNGKRFVCQMAMTLFERCASKQNQACESYSLVCSSFGICISRIRSSLW